MKTEISKEVRQVFKLNGIDVDKGVLHLLAVYYGVIDHNTSKKDLEAIAALNIYSFVPGGVNWSIPLFSGEAIDFSWVNEKFIPLFARCGKNKYGSEAMLRFRQLFKDNPKLTPELIIQATKDYLDETPVRYVMNPHYFVTKGNGAQKTHTILSWVNYPKEDGESKFEDEDMDDSNKLFV